MYSREDCKIAGILEKVSTKIEGNWKSAETGVVMA